MYFQMKDHSFYQIKKTFLIFLLIALPATGYLYYEIDYRGSYELPTSRTSTSTEPVLKFEAFASGLQQYEQLYQAVMAIPRDHVENNLYTIPGLLSTRTLAGNHTHTPEICTSMTPQGIAVSDQYLFISSYCHTRTHNSVIYVVDKESHDFIKEIILPGKPHVGSLAYDPVNSNLWVCGSGNGLPQANAISMDTILDYSFDDTYEPVKYSYSNHVLEMQRSSFMTCYNGHIYIGFFHHTHSGVLRKYPIEEDGNLLRSVFNINGTQMESGLSIDAVTIPKQTQGMSFYYGKLLLSQSLGILPSRLVIFNDSDNNNDYLDETAILSFRFPRMMEQIYIYEDELYMIFESGAYAYRNWPTFYSDRVLKLDINELTGLKGN